MTTKSYKATLSSLEAVSATRAGAKFVCPLPWLCTTTLCPAVIGGAVVYSDNGHVARSHAAKIAAVIGIDLHAAGL